MTITLDKPILINDEIIPAGTTLTIDEPVVNEPTVEPTVEPVVEPVVNEPTVEPVVNDDEEEKLAIERFKRLRKIRAMRA